MAIWLSWHKKLQGDGNGNESVAIFVSEWRSACESQKTSGPSISVERVFYEEHEYNK